MARAADMMDFDEEDEDSGSDSEAASEPVAKKQRPNGRKKSRSPSAEGLQDDLEAVNVLQLQVSQICCWCIDGYPDIWCRWTPFSRPYAVLLPRVRKLHSCES